MRRFSLVQRVGLFAACVAALVGVLFVAALFAILSLRQAESRESRSKDVTVAALRVRTRTSANYMQQSSGHWDNVFLIASVSRGAAAGPAAGSEAKRRIGQINGTLDHLLAAEDQRAQQASAHARKVVERAARDVTAWNQLGCLSPHVIYVQSGGAMSPEKFAELCRRNGGL